MRRATNIEASIDDPTLAALVPQRSRRRNLILVAVGVFVLLGAWGSQPMLRPSFSSNYAGSWSALGPHHQVLTIVSLAPDSWPYSDAIGIDNVDGAQVSGAWIVPDAQGRMDASVQYADFPTGLAYLKALLPDADLDRDALPQRLRRGTPTQLIVLWNIDSCARLGPDASVRVELRSVLRTTSRANLPEFFHPGSNPDLLAQFATCPD